jgi:MFS family permease
MLSALGMAVASPLAGRLADRIGTRPPLATGLALEALGLAALSRAGATTPIVLLGAALFCSGFGLGLFQVPNVVRVMTAFPAGQQGAAGGLTFLARTLGIVAGVVTLSAVFAHRRALVGLDAAFAESFLLAAGVVVVAAAVAALAQISTRRRGP